MKFDSRFFAALSVAALGLLPAACSPPVNDPRLPPPGSSPSFAAGYTDGCWTGYADANRDPMQLSGRKDEQRFANDPEYRAGFPQGYKACFQDEERTPAIHPDGTA